MPSWPPTMLQLKSTSRYNNRGKSLPWVALAPAAGTQAGRI